MLTGRLSSKGHVTIPRKVRERLGVKPGDLIAYEMKKGVVTIRRLEPFDAAFHAALSTTLDEWSTPEDDEAFRDLWAGGSRRGPVSVHGEAGEQTAARRRPQRGEF